MFLDLRYFKQWFLLDDNLNWKYQRCNRQACKDFSLWQRFNSFPTYHDLVLNMIRPVLLASDHNRNILAYVLERVQGSLDLRSLLAPRQVGEDRFILDCEILEFYIRFRNNRGDCSLTNPVKLKLTVEKENQLGFFQLKAISWYVILILHKIWM